VGDGQAGACKHEHIGAGIDGDVDGFCQGSAGFLVGLDEPQRIALAGGLVGNDVDDDAEQPRYTTSGGERDALPGHGRTRAAGFIQQGGQAIAFLGITHQFQQRQPMGQGTAQQLGSPGIMGLATTLAVGEHHTCLDLHEKLIEVEGAELFCRKCGHGVSWEDASGMEKEGRKYSAASCHVSVNRASADHGEPHARA
jgi:hypothetical protein